MGRQSDGDGAVSAHLPSTIKRQRLTFWIVAVLLLGLLALPSLAPLLLK